MQPRLQNVAVLVTTEAATAAQQDIAPPPADAETNLQPEANSAPQTSEAYMAHLPAPIVAGFSFVDAVHTKRATFGKRSGSATCHRAG